MDVGGSVRYYNSRTGRYITSDPLGLTDGPNTYSYVGNNPINYVDPTGLIRWEGTITTTSLIVVVGATYSDMVLESECINGQKVKAKLVMVGPAVGAGWPFGATVSTISFDDGEKEIKPTRLNGTANHVAAGAAYGGGVGANITRVGGQGRWRQDSTGRYWRERVSADASGVGIAGGFDYSMSWTFGSSTITDLDVIDCECTQ